MRRTRARRLLTVIATLLTMVVLSACAAIPRDSADALQRIRRDGLRVGVVANPPWTVLEDNRATGLEPQLLERWASELATPIVWRPGDIDDLADALHRRDIDVLVGGLDQKSPYAPRLALTQPYHAFEDVHGKNHRLVLAVIPGESALLFELDKFLASREAKALIAAHGASPIDEGP